MYQPLWGCSGHRGEERRDPRWIHLPHQCRPGQCLSWLQVWAQSDDTMSIPGSANAGLLGRKGGFPGTSVSRGHHDQVPQMGWGEIADIYCLIVWMLKSKVKVSTDLLSPEAFRWLADGRLLCVPTWPFLCVGSSLGPFPLLTGTPVLMDQGPTLPTSFTLKHLCKGPTFNTITLGLRASTTELGRTQCPLQHQWRAVKPPN